MTKMVRQWITVNKTLDMARFINLSIFVLFIITLFFFGYLSWNSSLVVVMEKDKKTFLMGERKNIPIGQKEIESFLKKFIQLRYNWDGFIPERIIKNIAPFSTQGFKESLLSKLQGKEFKEIRGKNIRQIPVDPRMFFEKKKVVVVFDKLIKIDGVSLVTEKQVLFILKKGKSSQWNPMGIYVNGVIEHEKKN